MPNMSQTVPLSLNKLSEKKRERMTETPQELRSMLMKGIFACFNGFIVPENNRKQPAK